MSTANGTRKIAFDAGQERWPIFWCSLLSPVLLGEIPYGKRERYFCQLSREKRLLPNGQRRCISERTLRRQWKRLWNEGLAGLYRRKRCDLGKPRLHRAELVARAVELKKEQPNQTEVQINQSLQTEFHATIPRSTLYCYLRRAGATRLKLRTLRQDRDTNEHRWEIDRKWLTKLSCGNLTAEELLAKTNQHIGVEDVTTLLQCIREQPSYYSNRAVAVLSHYSGIPLCHIMAFLGVTDRSVRRWVRILIKHGVQVLLRSEFPGRGPHNKVKDQEYITAVFEILHAPPSTYGINRTTWRLKDLVLVMTRRGLPISDSGIAKIVESAGYNYRKAKRVLTSTDPKYKEKLKEITRILSNLGPKEKFFSVDEFGPFSVKIQGGRSLTPPGQTRTFPQYQKSKGSLIITAALELSTNQITHFYSPAKNTAEMIKLLDILVEKYADQECIYFSWDAASWHASNALYERVDEINNMRGKPHPLVKLAPLPKSAQFLNVIESVFSGLAKAVLHNSDYESVEACKKAIDRHFEERNQHFEKNPKRAGKKIWGKEVTKAAFSESNNCKNPNWR
jgi:transposase